MQNQIDTTIQWLGNQVMTSDQVDRLHNMMLWQIRSLSPLSQLHASFRSIRSSLIDAGPYLTYDHTHNGRHLHDLGVMMENLRQGRPAQEDPDMVERQEQFAPQVPERVQTNRHRGGAKPARGGARKTPRVQKI